MAEELKMYTEYRDGKPWSYLYGPPWKAMELAMEGGYPTPEEAKMMWEFEKSPKEALCLHCGEKRSCRLRVRITEMKVRGVTFAYPEYVAQCTECNREVYFPCVNDANAVIRERYYEDAKE